MPTLTTLELQRRILGFVRGPRLLALVGVHGDRTVADVAVARDIADSWGFDDAEGAQLDALGSILQLERAGEDDARYRVLLRMQAQVLLSSVGSTAVLENIATIWSGVEPVFYTEPPSGLGHEATIGVTVDLDDYSPLLTFLRKAKVAGVRINVHVGDADALILDNWPNPGILDYTPETPRAASGTLAYPHHF